MVMINIDKDMLLVELYELRATITGITMESDETAAARKKIDQVVSLISNAPVAESQSSLPRISVRSGRR
jgi:hypothetical protein